MPLLDTVIIYFQMVKTNLNKTENSIIIKTAGNFSVITKRGIFQSPPSDSVKINLIPKPSKPIVSVESIGLKSSSLANNQWYSNNEILKDSINQYLRGVGFGPYTVRVTENGCFSESDVFVITSLEPNSESIKLYPNPNEGIFWIELPKKIKSYELTIYDLKGAIVLNRSNMKANSNKERIEIKTPGNYILKIISNKKAESFRFIVN